MSNKLLGILLGFLSFLSFSISAQQQCTDSVVVQVLGSGGPEINDGRTSSSYLIWHQGKARVLMDLGSGSSVQFDLAKADFADLDAIFLSHMHTDHSADLPSFIKGSFFTSRERDLLLFGPEGNNVMPSTTEFTQRLFGEQGAFAYLSDYLHKGRESYQLIPFDISVAAKTLSDDITFSWGSAVPMPVHHGPNPAVAWRVNIGGCVIAYSGDMSNKTDRFADFIIGADLVIAHLAIPDSAGRVAKNLHMPPQEIAQILKKAAPKRVLLSHFMRRSERHMENHLQIIRAHYPGQIILAEELLTLPLGNAK